MNLEGKGFPGPQRLFESNVIDFERVEDVLLPGLTAPLAAIQPDLPLFGMQLQSEQLQNILRTVALSLPFRERTTVTWLPSRFPSPSSSVIAAKYD